MNIQELLIFRQELILTLVIFVLLILKLSLREHPGQVKNLFFINALLLVNLVAGLFPFETGSLFGGMYQTNPVFVIEKNLLNLGTFLVALQVYDWLKNNVNAIDFYLVLLSTLLGMFFMISSGHFLMFYLGLELATIPVAALAAFEKDKPRSAEAGIKMILSSAFSSGFLLLGISLLYGSTGTLAFSELAPALTGTGLQVFALVLVFAAFAFKISLVPFHLWTADVYEGSPIGITSYLSVISKSAVIFIFLSVLYTVFGGMFEVWKNILFVASVITMTTGNIFALRQNNLKRFLAFSSIAQAGYIVIGILGSSAFGMTSVVYFILIYIFSNLGAFGVVSAISQKTGKERLEDYKGLYQTNPRLSLLMLLSMFSLAGIPPTAGFFGKFFLLTAAAGQGLYILVLIATLNMIISLYYYLRVVRVMVIDKNEQPIEQVAVSGVAKAGLTVCAVGIIITGFISQVFDYIYSLSFGM